MATTPTVMLTGNLKMGLTPGTAVDVEDAVTFLAFRGSREVIEVPATMSLGRKGVRAGSDSYEVEVGYLQDPVSASSLAVLLWEALDASTNPAGTVYYEGTLRPGPAGGGNPQYSGYFIATAGELGGEVGKLLVGRSTFRAVDRPDRTIPE